MNKKAEFKTSLSKKIVQDQIDLVDKKRFEIKENTSGIKVDNKNTKTLDTLTKQEKSANIETNLSLNKPYDSSRRGNQQGTLPNSLRESEEEQARAGATTEEHSRGLARWGHSVSDAGVGERPSTRIEVPHKKEETFSSVDKKEHDFNNVETHQKGGEVVSAYEDDLKDKKKKEEIKPEEYKTADESTKVEILYRN